MEGEEGKEVEGPSSHFWLRHWPRRLGRRKPIPGKRRTS